MDHPWSSALTDGGLYESRHNHHALLQKTKEGGLAPGKSRHGTKIQLRVHSLLPKLYAILVSMSPSNNGGLRLCDRGFQRSQNNWVAHTMAWASTGEFMVNDITRECRVALRYQYGVRCKLDHRCSFLSLHFPTLS